MAVISNVFGQIRTKLPIVFLISASCRRLRFTASTAPLKARSRKCPENRFNKWLSVLAIPSTGTCSNAMATFKRLV